MQKGKIYEEMLAIEKYFQRQSLNNSLFIPEFEIAQEVNAILRLLDQIIRKDAERLLTTFNRISTVSHFDGSGWLDYKMQLVNLLKNNGFAVISTEPELTLK
jgi:hypothetical protein